MKLLVKSIKQSFNKNLPEFVDMFMFSMAFTGALVLTGIVFVLIGCIVVNLVT